MYILQQSCAAVAAINFDAIVVAAGNEEKTSVWCESKIARMARRALIAYLANEPVGLVDAINGNAIVLQAVRGVEKMSVGTKMDIGTAVSRYLFSQNVLHGKQIAVDITENNNGTAQFVDEIHKLVVAAENEMARAPTLRTVVNNAAVGKKRSGVVGCCVGIDGETVDAVVAEIGDEEIFAIGSGTCAMNVTDRIVKKFLETNELT